MKGREWYQADDIAEAYDEKRFSRGGRLIDRRERQAVLDGLSPVEEREVLEIACGTGRFSVMLAERGASVTALDVSEAMLSQGREKAERAGVRDRIEFMLADAGRLPFPEDSFEAVFAMRFFHLADEPERYLAEMARVARDRVFFDTFNGTSARVAYNWLLPMGSHLYDRERVDGLLDTAGLSLEAAEHDFVVPFGFYRKLPNAVADGFRRADLAVGRTAVGDRLASVSYWRAAADGEPRSATRAAETGSEQL